ncbi:hypothetical protein D0Z03_002322 [Geotrichum reessii]|nr:hypothetical protein D0Z03_002322 [Galactomyces reessii]
MANFNGDPFVPISTQEPLNIFNRQEHPCPAPTGSDTSRPIHTNKFYTNMLIENQDLQTWCQPYSLWWSKIENFYGMAVSHTHKEQFVFGPNPDQRPAQFYFSPVGIQSIVFSATEFDSGNVALGIEDSSDLSVKAILTSQDEGVNGKLTLPLVQGMGMVTGVYDGLRAKIVSQVGIANVESVSSPRPNLLKYILTLFNNVKWVIYVLVPEGIEVPTFYLTEDRSFVSNLAGSYVIQIAEAPENTLQTYDACAGKYLTGASITGEIVDNGSKAIYRIQYEAEGSSVEDMPLVFAAPHHVASNKDPYFPRWRSFDWYAGHSWAKGIMPSADGKDQESSSEDFHFAYGMKLWGRVIGDPAMESRGNLMLAVLKRSMNTYMYYRTDNTTMPEPILGNKVSGILFENKVDYATWFSARTECKHGIHMIPITSVSSFIRGPEYVKEEWDEKLGPIINDVDDGWKGILYSNMALYDPVSSYNFFAQTDFDNKWLDDGMSRTWALAYPACINNSQI